MSKKDFWEGYVPEPVKPKEDVTLIDEGKTAQRTWVGLTEPERLACYDLNPARFASAIEAKLRERNT